MKKFSVIFIFIVFFITNIAFCVELRKPINADNPSFSGDNQVQLINTKTESPIRVLVVDENNKPLANHKLIFRVINYPKNAKNFKIINTEVITDSTGIAENYFKLGDKEGFYEILVLSADNHEIKPLLFTIKAQKKSWVFFIIMGLLGGIAIFLFGMDFMSKGLQTSAGTKLRNILHKFTSNRFLALIAGIITTVVFQSSSATSVMLVGFVEAGILTFAQTLGMLLGAGIGTTITAQLIALKLTDYSLIFVALGFFMMIAAKKNITSNIGKAILGFGFIFFGMFIMSEAMYPLREYPEFINLMLRLENPFLGILIGFVFTALIQSSAAFIGILITIGSKGLISLEAAIPLILGANLGTGMTAILASINTGREAKRVAFAHTLFKFIGVIVFVWLIPEFAIFLKKITPAASNEMEDLAKVLPFQIANTHTFFSLFVAALLLPLINTLAKLINFIIPDKKTVDEKLSLKYIDKSYISSPALALSLAKKETERMGETVKELVSLSLVPFINRDDKIFSSWQILENESDFLKKNINKYLISVGAENSSPENLNEAFQIMYVVKELEMIGDIVNTNIKKHAEKFITQNLDFSEEGQKELIILQEKCLNQISRSMEVFSEVNLEKAAYVKSKFKKYSALAEELERHHYSRLIENNTKSISSSEIHLELIGLLNAINRHATNISRILINWNLTKN